MQFDQILSGDRIGMYLTDKNFYCSHFQFSTHVENSIKISLKLYKIYRYKHNTYTNSLVNATFGSGKKSW